MTAIATEAHAPNPLQDVRLLELMASRLCHDLISPVGAINNGVELLEEMGGQMGDEAVRLIGHSATQASRRLKLFRLCYGAAGSEASLGLDDVLVVARDYLAGGRVTLNWSTESMKALGDLPQGLPKVALNCVIIAAEILVHGGIITATATKVDNKIEMHIEAEGRAAGTRTEAWPALKGEVPIAELTPKSVHAYLTQCFASQYNVTLGWEQPAEEKLVFVLSGTV